jgi:hypothetical protein
VLVPHSPSTINDLFSQFRDTMVAGNALSTPPDTSGPVVSRLK